MRRIIGVLLALLLTGCYPSALENTRWELVEMEGQPAYYPVTLAFTGPRSFTGDAGCNAYEGTYTVKSGGRITMNNVFTTAMACLENMQEEAAYVDHLANAVQYTLTDDTLTIGTAANPTALVFTRTE